MPEVKPKRDSTGRWLPGSPGGPGRPKGAAGVAKMIMEATENGGEMVRWFLDVWRDAERPHRDRVEAVQWLADRGLGKALASIELSGDLSLGVGPKDLKDMSDAELHELVAALPVLQVEETSSSVTLPTLPPAVVE